MTVQPALADRLVRAAGFRNIVAHAYESLDLRRVHQAATDGPADLLQCLGRLKDYAP
ncbi:MAG: DUF86 domain-containing protein [Acidobacteria bacterium]|nr:DUF86 domain-containing protein [Acidobacteriota bacterium]